MKHILVGACLLGFLAHEVSADNYGRGWCEGYHRAAQVLQHQREGLRRTLQPVMTKHEGNPITAGVAMILDAIDKTLMLTDPTTSSLVSTTLELPDGRMIECPEGLILPNPETPNEETPIYLPE